MSNLHINEYGQYVRFDDHKAGYAMAVNLPYNYTWYGLVVTETISGFVQAEPLPYVADDGYLLVTMTTDAGFAPAKDLPFLCVRETLVVIRDDEEAGYATSEVLGDFFDDEYVYDYSTNALEVFEIDPLS